MQKIPIDELTGLLEGLQNEQKALQVRKHELIKRKEQIDEELKQLEVRFHRGAGGILAFNELLNRYGSFPQLRSSARIFAEFDIPVLESEEDMQQALKTRTLGPAEMTEDELAVKRENAYERQAMDWVKLFDRREDEDAGSGDGVGPRGSAVGESGSTQAQSLGSEPDQRQSEDGRPK